MGSTERNIAAVRAIIETLDHGRLDELDSLVSPDYVLHDPSSPEDVRGVDGLKEMIELYRTGFGLRMTIEDQFADGDLVATRYTSRGTHNVEFMGMPATGKPVTVSGICLSRCRDGKVVEEWEVWDALGALRQTGALPETLISGAATAG
jgi:steroid delta-isomerase-like uncharacterized protein